MSTLRTLGIALASAATAASLTISGQAVAHHGSHGDSDGHSHAGAVPPPPASPTSDDQIQNIDQVKTAIKAYYGDTVTTTPDPVNGATTLHKFDPNGAYAHQMQGLGDDAAQVPRPAGPAKATGTATGTSPRHKAILFDIDDTTLNTYNYEIYSNFVYNPTTNAAFVNGAVFPAVPGMIDLVDWPSPRATPSSSSPAAPRRSDAGTETNLANGGYRLADDHLYLKDHTAPWLELVRTHLHHHPVQVPDPPAHRVAGLRHRGQLRRPVQRPQRRLRGQDVQDPEPDVLPALISTGPE